MQQPASCSFSMISTSEAGLGHAMERYSWLDFFKVSERWSCDAGRWPVSKVKKNILCVGTVSTHVGSNLTAQVKSRSTSSKQLCLVVAVTHCRRGADFKFCSRACLQAERSVSITMSCRSGLACLTSEETKGSLF